MNVPNCKPLLAVFSVALALSACGGGGGGGGNSASAPPAAPPAPAPDPTPPPTPPTTPGFTISGSITASASQATDSDNNDPGRPAVSNNSLETAQSIPNPITLGGYINEPGAGAEGRSQQSGDLDDFYRVELLAGQSVTMLVSDYGEADADLYLYNDQGNVIDFSIEIGEIESLVIPADGTYLINAFAFDGATNYILAIGDGNTAGAVQKSRYRDIVPWQAVVRYREDDSSAGSDQATARHLAQQSGLEFRAGSEGRSRLMGLLQSHAAAVQRTRQLGVAMHKKDAIVDPQLRAYWETMLTIKHLRRDPRVAHAEPNYLLRALAEPNDQAYPFQWHYPLISLPAAWDTTTGDPSAIVAVIDTGILSEHPDLAGQFVDGYDFVSNPASAQDGDGIDPDPEDSGSGAGASADNFHGSHVSGTVAARGNNDRGVAGTAYGASIMPLRALGAGGVGTSYDIDQAIRYAAGLPNDSGTTPQRRAAVINLSLGGPFFSQGTQELIQQVRNAGVSLVAAAGNEGSTLPSYPAAYDGVISVSAVDSQRKLTLYSNSGPTIDVAAPGGDNGSDLNGDGYPDGVLSTGGSRNDNSVSFEYTFLSGTSMAAPHVAGVVALMKSVNPLLTPEDIDVLLETNQISDDLGVPGRDDLYGFGLINAQRAVLAALEATGNPPADNPRLTVSASTLNFASTTNILELVFENGGKGELELLDITVSDEWLTVAPLDVDGNGLGIYQVTVDRENLGAGVYAGSIQALSSVNGVSVRVLLSVGGSDTAADVGLVYVLLYESASDEVVGQFPATGQDGRYDYQFTDIPTGEYEILAGSDADNDLFICDAGEACGAWLTLDQPKLLDLQEDTSGVDFPIDYLVTLPSILGNGAGTRQAAPIRALPPRPISIAK